MKKILLLILALQLNCVLEKGNPIFKIDRNILCSGVFRTTWVQSKIEDDVIEDFEIHAFITKEAIEKMSLRAPSTFVICEANTNEFMYYETSENSLIIPFRKQNKQILTEWKIQGDTIIFENYYNRLFGFRYYPKTEVDTIVNVNGKKLIIGHDFGGEGGDSFFRAWIAEANQNKLKLLYDQHEAFNTQYQEASFNQIVLDQVLLQTYTLTKDLSGESENIRNEINLNIIVNQP